MFKKADPLSTFAWVAGCSIAMLFFRNPVSGAVMTATLLILLIVDRSIPLLKLVRSLPLVLMVPTALLFFHSVSHEGVALVELGPLTVTQEGLREGSRLFFRLAFVILASLTFLWTSDIRELMAGMVRIGLPYPAAFAIYLTLRYIPVLRVERDIILNAVAVRRQSRSIRPLWRMRLWTRYLLLLVVNGIRKAEQTATALQARAFGAERQRTFITPFRFSIQGIMLVVGSALLISTLFWTTG